MTHVGIPADLLALRGVQQLQAKNITEISGFRKHYHGARRYIVMTPYEMQARHLLQIVYPMQENFEREMKARHIFEDIPIFLEQIWRFEVDDGENIPP